MVTVEQIKLLESKITRAIEALSRMNEENLLLKKRNEELEELAGKLEEEKSKVELGIASALERLNQFEDAIERTLTPGRPASTQAAALQSAEALRAAEEAALLAKLEAEEALAREKAARAAASQPAAASMPAAYTEDEADDSEEALDAEGETGESELDIF